MKIVYACFLGNYSLLFLNLALRKHNLPIRTLLISTKPLKIKSKDIGEIKSTKDLFSVYGFRYALFCITVKTTLKHSLNLLKRLSDSERFSETLWPLERLVQEYNLTVIRSDNFNSEGTQQKLLAEEYDVLLSCFCNQIFGQKTLSIAKTASLNIHPSILPNDKGVDPLLQMMLRGEKRAAVTLHAMTDVIDDGPIIARKISACEGSYFRNTTLICELAAIALAGYVAGKEEVVEPVIEVHGYKSWPTGHEMRTFSAKGLRFFDFKTLFQMIFCPLKMHKDIS